MRSSASAESGRRTAAGAGSAQHPWADSGRSVLIVRRRRAAAVVAQGSTGSEHSSSSTTSPARPAASIYGGVLQALKSSASRSDLERELFGRPHPPDIRTCTAQVRAAKAWPEAKEVLQQAQQAGVDGPFLGALFTALPKLVRSSSTAASSTPASTSGSSSSSNAGSSSSGNGAMRHANNPFHASRYGATPAEQERLDLMSALNEVVEQHVVPLARQGQLDAAQVVSCAVGLAKLGYRDPAAYEQLVVASVPLMGEGLRMPDGLINMMWALATAGVRPSGAWLTGFWEELDSHAEVLTGTDLATICWSICRLELMPPWVSGPHDHMSGTLLATMQRAAQRPSGQDAATVLVCLAVWSRSFSFHPPEQALADMLAALQPHLHRYLPADLVSVVHSLVVLNASPPRSFYAAFYATLRDRLVTDPQLSLSDFQRLLWALSRVDYVPSQAWLKQFVEVSVIKLKFLRFRALSELIWALACWGYTPTNEWLAEYFRVTQAKLRDFKPPHLANAVLALKKLGCKVPGPWLEAALASFCAQLQDVRAHDLVTFLDALVDCCDDAAFMQRAGPAILDLANHAASKFDVCDTLLHAKLLVALGTAKCYPGAAWLARQQESLARALGAEPVGALDRDTAVTLRAAYATLDAPLDARLSLELELKAGGGAAAAAGGAGAAAAAAGGAGAAAAATGGSGSLMGPAGAMGGPATPLP